LGDCYLRLVRVEGHSAKSKSRFEYSNIPSTIIPVPHSKELPVLHPPLVFEELISSYEELGAPTTSHFYDPEFVPQDNRAPQRFT